MCGLYRVENETCIEMSPEAWALIQDMVEDGIQERLQSAPKLASQLTAFTNAIRSHLQHLEAEKRPSPPPPADDNMDLV